MCEQYINRFVEVLTSTFSACDDDETGFVEINRLVNFLISQESWVDNEVIREELNSVLQGNVNKVISKEEFITSLRGWFEVSLYQDEEEKREKVNRYTGKCSSSTSGVEDSSEITSGSSTNSMEDIYYGTNFVSDGQTFTNENMGNEISLNDSISPQSDLRLVKVLQSEVSTLLRKNEYVEKMNESLLGQVSSLEDALSKKKEESEDYRKQLIKSNERLETHMQKYDENEERMNLFMEENRCMATELTQTQRENSKLKAFVSDIEIKLENSLSDNLENVTKLEKITNKFNTVNNLYNNSLKMLEQERENVKSKENERENTLREIIEENKCLKSQLDSNTLYIEDIKCRFRDSLKEACDTNSSKIKNILKRGDSSGSATSPNSMILFDGNVSLDSTIPFESSLLAELKEEIPSDKQECCCVCKQSVCLTPLPPLPDTVDAAVGTNAVETMEKSTMVEFHNPKKNSQVLEDRKSTTFHQLKSKRSTEKWAVLFAVLLILCFVFVFLCLHIFLSLNLKSSHKSTFYFTYLLDLLQVQVKYSNILPMYQ